MSVMEPRGRHPGRFRLLVEVADDLIKVRRKLDQLDGVNHLTEQQRANFERLCLMLDEATHFAHKMADEGLGPPAKPS